MTATAPETPGPDHVRDVFARYAQALSEGDTDGLVALFTPDATLEDPIGTEPHRGHAAIARCAALRFPRRSKRIGDFSAMAALVSRWKLPPVHAA